MGSDERPLYEFQTPTENAGRERDLGNTFPLATNALVAQWSSVLLSVHEV